MAAPRPGQLALTGAISPAMRPPAVPIASALAAVAEQPETGPTDPLWQPMSCFPMLVPQSSPALRPYESMRCALPVPDTPFGAENHAPTRKSLGAAALTIRRCSSQQLTCAVLVRPVTGLQLAPGFADGLGDQIKAVHGGRDAEQPGRLLEPFVVARHAELARDITSQTPSLISDSDPGPDPDSSAGAQCGSQARTDR